MLPCVLSSQCTYTMKPCTHKWLQLDHAGIAIGRQGLNKILPLKINVAKKSFPRLILYWINRCQLPLLVALYLCMYDIVCMNESTNCILYIHTPAVSASHFNWSILSCIRKGGYQITARATFMPLTAFNCLQVLRFWIFPKLFQMQIESYTHA